MSPIVCAVYRSSKKAECYLYIDKQRGLSCLPEALLELFGKPISVMTMILRPEKTLARVDVVKVIDGLATQGYFLQLPPPMDAEMQKIHLLNAKIPQ